MTEELKTFKVTIIRSQYEYYEYYEVHANSEEEALESYHGYNPTDTETIDVSFEDAKEIEDGEY